MTGWRAGRGEAGLGRLHPHRVSRSQHSGPLYLGPCASVLVGTETRRLGWPEVKLGPEVSRSSLLPSPQDYQAPQPCAHKLFADKLLVNGEELQ